MDRGYKSMFSGVPLRPLYGTCLTEKECDGGGRTKGLDENGRDLRTHAPDRGRRLGSLLVFDEHVFRKVVVVVPCIDV